MLESGVMVICEGPGEGQGFLRSVFNEDLDMCLDVQIFRYSKCGLKIISF